MKNEIDSRYYICMAVLCALFFACGYKVGDSSGYKDGYNEGYRYDCKEEIASIYKQVKAQSKFLEYSDSAIKNVIRQNDSLKDPRTYARRYADSVAWAKRFHADTLKYSVVSRLYSDSINKVVGGSINNFIQQNGSVCNVCCERLSVYRGLRECQDGFDIKKVLDAKLKAQRKSKKGNK